MKPLEADGWRLGVPALRLATILVTLLSSGCGDSPLEPWHQQELTEEFTAVYRLHPLLPEELSFWSSDTGDLISGKDKVPFLDIATQ